METLVTILAPESRCRRAIVGIVARAIAECNKNEGSGGNSVIACSHSMDAGIVDHTAAENEKSSLASDR